MWSVDRRKRKQAAPPYGPERVSPKNFGNKALRRAAHGVTCTQATRQRKSTTMQEKEVLEEAETKVDITSTSSDSKDEEKKEKQASNNKKDHGGDTKERSTFKRHRTKKDKNDPLRFKEGVNFKAKLIGVENVHDARGDKMCQDSLQRLKAAVKSAGEHKKKIIVNVSLDGIKIKEEKLGEVLHHHAVHLISFISQDVTDTRAFGYIFGSPSEGHQFIGIKTEKQACHVVLCLKDLFQVVLFLKQEKMVKAKELQSTKQLEEDSLDVPEVITDGLPAGKTLEDSPEEEEEENKTNDDHIYTDVILSVEKSTEDIEQPPPAVPPKKNATIDDLLGLQDEIEKLQQGIEQMDSSMQAFANFDVAFPKRDPFDTDYVIIPKQDVNEVDKETTIPPVMVMTSSPISPTVASSTLAAEHQSAFLPDATGLPYRKESTTSVGSGAQAIAGGNNLDKYAVFAEIGSQPSIFENPDLVSERNASAVVSTSPPDFRSQEEVIEVFSQTGVQQQQPPPIPPLPAKPPRGVKATDASIFADLDPLGKGRPYRDKKDFFQELKNPPKKVMKEMVDKDDTSTVSRSFDLPASSGVDGCSLSPPSRPLPPFIPPRPSIGLSSSLPISLSNASLSVAPPPPIPISPFNPFNNSSIPSSSSSSPTPPPIPARMPTRASEPAFRVLPSPPAQMSCIYSSNKSTALESLYASPRTHHVEHSDDAESQPHSNVSSSSPIPIPQRQNSSSAHTGSPTNNEHYTTFRGPGSFEAESPTNLDFFGQNFGDFNGSSPGSGLSTNHSSSLQKTNNNNNLSTNSSSSLLSSVLNSHHNDSNAIHLSQSTSPTKNTHTSSISPSIMSSPHSPTSRPRPRPSSSAKGISPLASLPSQRLCSSPNASESVASVFVAETKRVVPVPNGVESVSVPCVSSSHKDIFSKKTDPFADDFFSTIPKKITDHPIASYEAA